MPTNPINPRIFRFLKELESNNNREWFNANKQRYLDEVRDPLLRGSSGIGLCTAFCLLDIRS